MLSALQNKNRVGNEATNRPSEDISANNVTGQRNRSRVINPARYKMMMMIIKRMMIHSKTMINKDIKEIQKTTVLGTVHVLRNVCLLFVVALWPNAGHGLLIQEVS